MNSLIPSKKSSLASVRPNLPRHAPTVTKASSAEVLSTQQSPIKSNKAHSAKRSSAPGKQITETQPTDESVAQKKKTHRSPRKALSTGSLTEVKAPTVLSQESVHILKRHEVLDPSTFFAEPSATPKDNTRSNTSDRNHHRNNSHKEQAHFSDPSPSSRRNTQLPSKSRRTQQRKDIEAMTEALQNSDNDSSPSPANSNYNTSSGYSSDEVVKTTEKVVTVPKADIKKRRNKRERVVSSPPTTNSVSAFPPLVAPTVEEPKTSAPKVTFAKPVQQVRRGSSPAIEIKHNVTPSIASSSFPTNPFDDNSIKAPRTPPPSLIPQAQTKASPLYAGPTFSNSPAPAELPIPSFYSRSPNNDSPISSGTFRPNSQPSTPTPARHRTTSATSFLAQHQFRIGEDIFKMDSVADLSSSKYNQSSHARDLLELLSASVTGQNKTAPPSVSFVNARIPTPPAFHNYHLPSRMMTSHPLQSRNTHEMTMNLRSLLKIE